MADRTRFGHRLVGQADDGEGRHARSDLHLHIDGPDFDAFERDRGDPLDHVRPCLHGRVAELFSVRQEHLGNEAAMPPA
jgi:hypothetical protein